MISRGSARDVTLGPATNRSCTDILFLLLFLGGLVLYAAVAYLSFNQGNPERFVTYILCMLKLLGWFRGWITAVNFAVWSKTNPPMALLSRISKLYTIA